MMQNNFFTSKKKFSIWSSAMLLALFSPLMLGSAFAQENDGDWRKVCNKQQGVDVCNTVNSIISDTGQPLTILNVIDVSGKQNQKRLAIQVPTGRVIPEGIRINVDGKEQKQVPYMVCNGPTCIADAPLDDKLFNAMQKGSEMTVSSVNFQGYENPVKVSLKGFTTTYKSSGMTDKDYQADQDKVQKALKMRQKELENKMKAAQEKAKSGQ